MRAQRGDHLSCVRACFDRWEMTCSRWASSSTGLIATWGRCGHCAHASSPSHSLCSGLRSPHDEIESATNLEASKRIDRARSRSAMACVWRRDDEWGQVTRARLLSWIHGVFLLLLLRKLIDRSRVVRLHSGSYVRNVHFHTPKNC